MFISYAQNGEDVLLYRALRHVVRGCYIDVGAADPVIDSVTCAFYERGWRGINIEPSPAAFARLAAARPEDLNLNIAAGETDGEMPFFLVEGRRCAVHRRAGASSPRCDARFHRHGNPRADAPATSRAGAGGGRDPCIS